MTVPLDPDPDEFVLPRLIRQRAHEHPDKIFLEDLFGHRVSYRDAHRESLRWAAAFARHGVASGETVATMIPNSAWAFSAWQGLAWLGGMDVPINDLYLGSRLKHIVDDSLASIIVVHEDYLDRLRTVASDLDVKLLVVIGDPERARDLPLEVVSADAFLGTDEPAITWPDPPAHTVATLLYTSGTTGPSKGVMVPWPALYASAVAAFPLEHMTPDDVIYHVGPTSHIGAHALPLAAALSGGTVVLRNAFSLSSFWDDIDRFGVTSTMLVGSMPHYLLSEPERADDAMHTLRKVMMTPVHPEIERFNKRFETVTRTIYGMTEVPFPFASVDFTIDDPASCGVLRDGYPWCEVRIVDENDYPVQPGQVGELVVRTDVPWTINSGYWNNPSATASAWRNGWFHTGDALREDSDGRFYFVDRLKDAIRRGGENISSFEVESEINGHAAVLESAVVAVPADTSEEEILAFVVLREGQSITAQDLHDELFERIPRFMVPRYFEFVGELPKTPTLRVKKAELRARGVGDTTWDRGPRARATR